MTREIITEPEQNDRITEWEPGLIFLMENIDEALILINKELKIITFSETFKSIYYKLTGKEVKSGDHILDYSSAENQPILTDVYARVFKGETIKRDLEIEVSGQKYSFISTYKPVKDKNQGVIAVFASLADVTERNKAEQKSVASENRFRALIENSHDGISLLGADGITKYVSPSVEKIFGYTSDEFINLDPSTIAHPDDKDRIFALLGNLMSQFGETVTATYRMLHKNGTWRYVKANITNMLHIADIQAIVFNYVDDTELVEAEKKKRRQHQENEALINSTQDLMWSGSKDLKLITCNKAYKDTYQQISGKDVQAADNILWADFFSPEYLNLWRELYMQALSGKHIKEEIYTPEMENLPKVWLEATLNPIYDGEKIIGVACHSRNITKRKRRKANLLEMNRKLETAESLTHIGYFERDLKSGSLFFSNELYNIFGLNAEDGIDAHRFYKLIYPEDMHKFINARQEALDTRTTTSAGFRIKRKDKSIRHVVIRITTEEDAKGNAVKLAGAIQDITESKMAHEKAEEYLKHLNIIFENTIDDFVLTDVNGFIKAFNATASETFLLNVNKELRIGESIYHYVELDRTLDFGIVFSKVLQGETFRYDMDYNRPEGKVWFNLSIRPVYTDNKINGVCITGRDVTERKAAEEQVVRNEKRFRALIESSEDAMVMLDEDLKVIYQSPSTKRILGFSFAEMKDKLWIENIHPDHRASVTEFMRDVLEKPGTPQFHIYRIKHKSGSWIWSEGTVTNFLQNEHIQAFVFNFRNVTDSMIHMRNIERQNEALREIAWMQSHVVRAPLARIMGLVNHLKSNFSQELQKDNVLGYLLSATYELDAVIKSIIKKTEQVENLTSPDKDITD